MKTLRIITCIAAAAIAIDYIVEKMKKRQERENIITEIMLTRGLLQRSSVSEDMIQACIERRNNPWATINMFENNAS